MKTPLYNEHRALRANMISFAGWDMPLLYLPAASYRHGAAERQGRGIIREHRHTREQASVFDTSHMGTFGLAGPTAEADVDRLITQSVASLKTGACSYGYLLAEDGGVLDDLICFRRGPDSLWLVVNAGTRLGDAAWIQSRLSAGTSFDDLSERTAKLDVQGPCSREQLERALDIALPELDYFHFQDITIRDVQCTVSRTGYTGEWGYEWFLPADKVGWFWNLLLERSDIEPAGLGARDSLRVEMGYPLYGHELGPERTPVAASRGRFIDMTKTFVGKEAVQHELEAGTGQVLVGLRLHGRSAARPHDRVMCHGSVKGEVTSGLFSPSLNVAVALAYVDRAYGQPGQELDVQVRGKALRATVAPLPFYTNGSATSAPSAHASGADAADKGHKNAVLREQS